jgi:hypothetical protein
MRRESMVSPDNGDPEQNVARIEDCVLALAVSDSTGKLRLPSRKTTIATLDRAASRGVSFPTSGFPANRPQARRA